MPCVRDREPNGDPLRESNGDGRELRADPAIGAGIQRNDGSANRRSTRKTDRCGILKSITGLDCERRRLREGTERKLQQIAARDALCFARAR